MSGITLINWACDALLGLYGGIPLPHRGRDRLVTFLSKRARHRWNGVRSMRRGGLLIESDLSVDDVGWTLYTYGCLDYWDERAIRGMLKPGSICIDIGAHIGYYSLLLSRWVGQRGRVLSYEPVPYTHSFFERNLQSNRVSNVTLQRTAIGGQTGTVRMAFPNGGRLGWSTVSDQGDMDVPCTTIDSEVARLGLEHLEFIKIDVEGYEPEVLAGAGGALRRMRPRIMFEVNRRTLEGHGSSPTALRDILLSHNYGLFVAGRGGLRPTTNLGDGPAYFNVFALPNC